MGSQAGGGPLKPFPQRKRVELSWLQNEFKFWLPDITICIARGAIRAQNDTFYGKWQALVHGTQP